MAKVAMFSRSLGGSCLSSLQRSREMYFVLFYSYASVQPKNKMVINSVGGSLTKPTY